MKNHESERKEISVDNKNLQDGDKNCESINSGEKQEKSSSSGSMKYTLDEGRRTLRRSQMWLMKLI